MLSAAALALAACPAAPHGAQAGQPEPSAAGAGPVVTVALGDRPLGIAAAGGHLYCALEGTGTLAILDVATHQEVGRLALSAGTGGFVRTMLDRRQVLVLDAGAGQLLMLDAGVHSQPSPGAASPPARGEVLHRLTVGTGEGRLALGDDNQSALVTTGSQDKAVLFAFQTDRGIRPSRTEIPLGTGQHPARPHPIDLKGGLVLAPSGASGEVQTIQLDSGARSALGSLGAIGSLALGTVEGKPQVALLGDVAKKELVLADLAKGSRTVLGSLEGDLVDIVVDPDKHWAFLAQTGSRELVVVDYAARTLLTRLQLAHAPASVALAPPVPGEVWAAGDDGALSVIDCTGALPLVKTTLQVGKGAHRMTFWGTRGYITNQDDGTMSVVDRIVIR